MFVNNIDFGTKKDLGVFVKFKYLHIHILEWDVKKKLELLLLQYFKCKNRN